MSRRAPPSRKDNSTDPDGEFAMNVPEHLFYLLFQVARHRDARFDAELAPVGLTLARWRTLAVIRRLASCSMKELSLLSTIDRTTLTRSVDQLVEAGLVDRHVPPTDRRRVMLTLSQTGEQTYGQAVNLLLGFNRDLVKGIDTEALRTLTRTMEAIIGNLITDPDDAKTILNFGRNEEPAR
jgi:MarR family transcriptional regulator for hemolysin